MRDFLAELWWPGFGFAELRVIHGDIVDQYWYQLPVQLDDLVRDAGERSAQADVYMGVLPRLHTDGKAVSCPTETRVLWADVDAKHHGDVKYDALTRITGTEIAPNVIVDSGNGYHVYWLLTEAVPWKQAEKTMRGIAKAIGGDRVYDRARILRVPGTLNHKTNPAKPVRLLTFDMLGRRRPSDFDDYLLPEEAQVVRSRPISGEPQQVPDWLNELIVRGAPQGQRSEASYKAALWLCRYGYSDEQIEAIFDSYPAGIGEKYHQKGRDGQRWLTLTLRAARGAA